MAPGEDFGPVSWPPAETSSTQGAVIIRRHRFNRFRQSDCPGSGSCHQALAWRLSSGLPRPQARSSWE